MRLINADVLVRDINADPYRTESEKSYDRCLVHRQPTVDAVEVVHCRDCKYSYYNKYCTNEQWKDNGATVTIESDDFCSYGERKEG